MIKYLVLDIDGTLTDGSIYYDEHGNEIKKFCTKDGTGIICARAVGIRVITLTGRECVATTRRMAELQVDYIFQNIKNKRDFLEKWMRKNNISKKDIGYIGDDINDLAAMRLCGFSACPADAIDEVKDISEYIATVNGGQGVVRDVIKYYLTEEEMWNNVINSAFGTGV